ncbi:MAG: metallophosphoesterase, partial [Deltaproteobacteria bacterium]|nr:metallophosphoesterase [Deltaproteobacteria bacterium]
QRAVEIFNREGVDLVLHAGDFVSPFAVRPLSALKCGFIGVWGNNDGDRIMLSKAARERIVPSPCLEELGGRRILLAHDLETLDSLVASRDYFLIVYGHTHKPDIRKQGETLVVNPGECGGWLYGRSTIALADLEKQTAELIEM